MKNKNQIRLSEKVKKAPRLLRRGGSAADGVVCFSYALIKIIANYKESYQKQTTPSALFVRIHPSLAGGELIKNHHQKNYFSGATTK